MSKSKFMKMAEEAGIEVTYREGRQAHPRTGERVTYELELDAPDGQQFVSSGCSCDCSMNGCLMEPERVTPDWPALCCELEAIIADGFEEAECDA